MRLVSRALVAALLILGLPAVARAQEQPPPPPLEDVTLRGRVLRADGSPAANTPLVVDAVNDSGFAFFAFFATFGMSAFSCFAGPNELCPIPNSKRFRSTTDANGNYSFTFRNAHRQGQQTDTDYVLSIGVASRHNPSRMILGSYELELLDAVHNAPDLRLWDPAITVTPRERAYEVSYEARAKSRDGLQMVIGDQPARGDFVRERTIDARAVEDATFTVAGTASDDVTAAGTIYHQRFTSVPVTRKGTLVPLSRGAACSATRRDGTRTAGCGYTDGELLAPGVADANPCRYGPGGEQIVTEDVITRQPVPCQVPVTEVTIDLGATKEVGEVRARCACALTASNDGAAWRTLPASGVLANGQQIRYVRLKGASLGEVPEVSVWPPWSEERVSPIEPLTPTTDGNVAQGPANEDADDDKRPWFLAALALALLVAVSQTVIRRATSRPTTSARDAVA
jgi:hypothetical protein